MAQFDPSEKGVDEVLKRLDRADREERDRILAAEAGEGGKRRKTILEKYGIDPDARFDATGRQLYPWEVTGADMADADRHPTETDAQRKAREAQAEQDATVASTPQLGSSPAGSGVAPAADAGTAGTTGGTTTATPATGTAGA